MEVAEPEYAAVVRALRQGAPAERILRMLETWKLEPLRARLDRVAEQLATLVSQLGKGAVAVHVRVPELSLARGELGEFWTAFSHVVRNAAVHAVESAEARRRVGKADAATFRLEAGIERERLFVQLADDGPGIDWDAIRDRAKAHGYAHTTAAELEEALFQDGVSTRQDVSEQAGRGVGLSAVRAACAGRRGSVRVTTERGIGTTFHFSWPLSELGSLMRLDPLGASA